jgi:hypothetical protein
VPDVGAELVPAGPDPEREVAPTGPDPARAVVPAAPDVTWVESSRRYQSALRPAQAVRVSIGIAVPLVAGVALLLMGTSVTRLVGLIFMALSVMVGLSWTLLVPPPGDIGVGPDGVTLRRGRVSKVAVTLSWSDIGEVGLLVAWAKNGQLVPSAREVFRFTPALPDFGGRSDLGGFRLKDRDATDGFTHGLILNFPTALDYGPIPGITELSNLLTLHAGPKFTGVTVTGKPDKASTPELPA